MAIFEGSIKEFTKFLGSHARMKVMQIAPTLARRYPNCYRKVGVSNEAGLTAI